MKKMKLFLNLGNSKTDKVIIISLIVAFIMGIFTIVIKQPMSWYDEETHYSRVLQISNGDFKVIQDEDLSQVGGSISVTENEFIDRSWNSKIINSNYPAVDLFWWTNYSDLSYSSDKIFRASTNTIPNNPVVYTPYVIVALFAKLIKLSPAIEFFFMRLVGFLVFFLIYLLAIRKSKMAKLPLSLLALVPTIFLTFASITADAYLVSVTALFLVYLFEFFGKVRIKENITQKDITSLSFVSILFSFSKMPNFLFIALLFPILYYMYNDRKKKKFIYQLCFTLFLTAAITIVWYLYVKDVNTGLYWGRNVDTYKQLSYIKSNIIQFVLMLVTTVLSFNIFEFQTAYGNINIYSIPLLIEVSCVVGLYLSTRTQQSEIEVCNEKSQVINEDRLFNISSIIIAILFINLVFLMLYLQFSEIGSIIIDGVQARYFIPIWILILLLISYNFKKIKIQLKSIIVLVCLPLITYVGYIIAAYLT